MLPLLLAVDHPMQCRFALPSRRLNLSSQKPRAPELLSQNRKLPLPTGAHAEGVLASHSRGAPECMEFAKLYAVSRDIQSKEKTQYLIKTNWRPWHLCKPLYLLCMAEDDILDQRI